MFCKIFLYKDQAEIVDDPLKHLKLTNICSKSRGLSW